MSDDTQLGFLSITALSQAIEARRLDPRDLTQRLLQRIAAFNPALNLYLLVCGEAALGAAAEAAVRAAGGGRLGPLDGVPVALKDNIDLAGVPTSNGFGGLPWRVPREDAEIVRRLRAAGAVILGKLNMHEGALGGTTDNPHFGPAINPHRSGLTPGGSSGGSGAAVAAGLCAMALGTDTGGSVRIPASYCGVVGFKPSHGLVSTRGVVPLSWRLDHVGPLTRTVGDARLVAAMLQGFDPQCPDSRRGPAIAGDTAVELAGLRLGVPRDFFGETIDPRVAAAFAEAMAVFERLGCVTRAVTLRPYDSVEARRAALLRIEVDAAVAHAELYRHEPERFSPAIRGFLDYGGRAAVTRLARADRVIEAASFALSVVFDEVDALLMPTTPQPAFAFADAVPDNQNAFCVLANFAGAPAISLPMGCTPDGLPLGLQIVGPRACDARVLRLAEAYEAAAGWRLMPPLPYGPAAA